MANQSRDYLKNIHGVYANTVPLYRWDVNIYRFCYPRGVTEPMPQKNCRSVTAHEGPGGTEQQSYCFRLGMCTKPGKSMDIFSQVLTDTKNNKSQHLSAYNMPGMVMRILYVLRFSLNLRTT